MVDMRLTDKQRDAVYTDKKTVLVSAAAGSGKTSVLTGRVIRMVQAGTDIRDMLVLTFTNAAAAEMKRRISRGLYEAAKSGGSEKLYNQSELFGTRRIYPHSTAFAQRR
jgi:ATP-dependent helicase/nuclease subunit A